MLRVRIIAVMLAMSTALIGCQPDTSAPASTSTPAAPTQTVQPADYVFDGHVGFSRGGLNVRLRKPRGWETFTTDGGIVVAEKFGTVADQGQLAGLMTYVFLTPLDDFPFDIAQGLDGSAAVDVLSSIIADDSYVGGSDVSAVEGFTWSGYDAAYYLLTDRQTGLRTLVIGVPLMQQGMLLTATLSAPAQLQPDIRTALPSLLGGLMINSTRLSPDDLAALPAELVFPAP
ncbi:MAG: hypothetical protein IT298_06845 [Chloroflexi bacterium]|nr:hypothetical protein [Chloroflexota bacterium]